MTIVTKTQIEDISNKLALIETLDVSREQKDLLIQYVKMMNERITFATDSGEEIGRAHV